MKTLIVISIFLLFIAIGMITKETLEEWDSEIIDALEGE